MGHLRLRGMAGPSFEDLYKQNQGMHFARNSAMKIARALQCFLSWKGVVEWKTIAHKASLTRLNTVEDGKKGLSASSPDVVAIPHLS